MVVGLAGCAAACRTGDEATVLAFAGAGVGAGRAEAVATGVMSGGLLTVATFRVQAATGNRAIAVIPVTSTFAWFIGFALINASASETDNPMLTVFLICMRRLDLVFGCCCRGKSVAGLFFWRGLEACCF